MQYLLGNIVTLIITINESVHKNSPIVHENSLFMEVNQNSATLRLATKQQTLDQLYKDCLRMTSYHPSSNSLDILVRDEFRNSATQKCDMMLIISRRIPRYIQSLKFMPTSRLHTQVTIWGKFQQTTAKKIELWTIRVKDLAQESHTLNERKIVALESCARPLLLPVVILGKEM